MKKLLYPDVNSILNRISELQKENAKLKSSYFYRVKWHIKVYQKCENDSFESYAKNDLLEAVNKKPEIVAEIKANQEEIKKLCKLLKHEQLMSEIYDI